MQVFCGITIDQQVAGAGHGDTACAVALVAAGGGLIATDTFGDDPRGWVRLNSLLARSAPGQSASVAVDGEVAQLAEYAAAAGHLVVRAASPASRSKDALDDAIAMARGLATGEVHGQPYAARPEINALRPILDTVASAARARHDAAEALTCLLRAVFPAALAAWDDPSEANAVAILTRLPQPGALQSISTEELAADLATVADPGQVAAMAGALTEAIREIGGGDDPSVAPSVSATAEAVSAWDRSLEGLIGLLQAKRPKPEAVPAAAEEAPSRHRGAETHRTVRLPGDLPDRQSLRALDPASQLHSVIAADLEATQVLPDSYSQPVDGESHTRSIRRRRRAQPAELPQDQSDAFQSESMRQPEPEARRHPWQPKEDVNIVDVASLMNDDDGLLILGQARSAWFKRPESEEPEPESWNLPGDDGWRTARHVTEAPETEEPTTPAGLPRRKPQANLVPGAVVADENPRFDEPIDRDPEVLAQNTAGYFKGWGRARGGRPGTAARTERMAAR
ncbi:hypothetical protein K3N28_06530 [Glycomyces sp. TRM65418]|uniref:hypothetical protein n=1 Tax=Glycomyces sp. TRM65418 TaxID=2867006 RepID=UPI001CE5C1A0|nr:hypothetical protein [Glycomyces sp. TRM65418]MCC3762725.1 hypothetical protein [Glycomyces sp. TRM65418]QZD56758.1 hypothetical protein K3N28_06480 [Glycomyces sp. TRM65418]